MTSQTTTTAQQIDKVVTDTKEAAKDLKDYTYAQKAEFTAKMKLQLAEIKGDELVVQFANGPTLYGKHESFTGKKDGFGVAGTKGGTVELDNVTVWSVKTDVNPQWEKTRAALPKFEPVVMQKAAAKKKK